MASVENVALETEVLDLGTVNRVFLDFLIPLCSESEWGSTSAVLTLMPYCTRHTGGGPKKVAPYEDRVFRL